MTNQKNIFVDQSSRLSKLKQQTISSGKKHYLPKYENSNNVIPSSPSLVFFFIFIFIYYN